MSSNYELPDLFSLKNLETTAVLKAAAKAHQHLGELKGVAATMPNQHILISTLSLQEAKESSEIENIITTQDDIYRSNYATKSFVSHNAKEVHSYAQALQKGFAIVRENKLLTNNTVQEIQRILEGNTAGFRKQSGTALKNDRTGEIIYTPPQQPDEIIRLMSSLEKFINNDELSDYDNLVKMAIIHHQFESIHPFYDGNGRTGRIVNILYLVKQDLLDTPILYLSRYINQNKARYYELLQQVRDEARWEEWLLFMLEALIVTSKQTIHAVNQIKTLMQQYKILIKEKFPNTYSHELLNNLFKYPYTKIEFIINELKIHRNTANKYLTQLVDLGLLSKHKIVNENYYLNDQLCTLLSNVNKHRA